MALTPYGRAYYAGWWRSITFPRDRIGEWAPLIRSPYVIGLCAFGLAVLFVVYAVGAPRTPRAARAWRSCCVTAWAAWRHERHVALFALAWFCAVPGYLAATPLGELLESAVARRRVADTLIVTCAAVGVALLAVALPRQPFRLRIPAQGSDLAAGAVVYPAGAVAYLAEAGFRGKLVTSFLNGGFVIWKLHPAARVSFDGRYEVAYAPEVLDEDQTIHRRARGLGRDPGALRARRGAGRAERAARRRAAGRVGSRRASTGTTPTRSGRARRWGCPSSIVRGPVIPSPFP